MRAERHATRRPPRNLIARSIEQTGYIETETRRRGAMRRLIFFRQRPAVVPLACKPGRVRRRDRGFASSSLAHARIFTSKYPGVELPTNVQNTHCHDRLLRRYRVLQTSVVGTPSLPRKSPARNTKRTKAWKATRTGAVLRSLSGNHREVRPLVRSNENSLISESRALHSGHRCAG